MMLEVDFAVGIAIIHKGKILLAKRSDVEAWSLPEGRVEAGESVAAAAVREALEETGLLVKLDRLVGIYYMPHWKYGDNHEVIFAASVISGEINPLPEEIVEAGFFSPQELPEPILWWHRQRIQDAVDGIGGSIVRMQNMVWPFKEQGSRKRFLRSGLSRKEFFEKYFSKPEHLPEPLEILLVGDDE
jgi:8-oxo-dGTP pyrophosphatase MutT (NUDIX family)